MLDAISHIERLVNLGDQFEVIDTLADMDAELVSINHPGKRLAESLTSLRLCKQILIPREKNSAERCGVIQQGIVRKTLGVIGLGSQYLDFSPAQSMSNRRRDMDVHVQSEAQ
jgi:hypothetical protein